MRDRRDDDKKESGGEKERREGYWENNDTIRSSTGWWRKLVAEGTKERQGRKRPEVKAEVKMGMKKREEGMEKGEYDLEKYI